MASMDEVVTALQTEFGEFVRTCSKYHLKVGPHNVWVNDRGRIKLQVVGAKHGRHADGIKGLIDLIKKAGQLEPKKKKKKDPIKPVEPMLIFCCGCQRDICAVLAPGSKCYPKRRDLADHVFWECPTCGNFVGVHRRHHDKGSRLKPLGCIATPEIKQARLRLHGVIDPIWQSGRLPRDVIYARLSKALGRQYHTAEIRSVDEARYIENLARQIEEEA